MEESADRIFVQDASRATTPRYAGAFDAAFPGPVQFLLMDQSVVPVEVDPPVIGVLQAGSCGVYTIFDINVSMSQADLELLANGGGVS